MTREELKKEVQDIQALNKLRTQGNYSASYHDEPANNGDDDEYNYNYTIISEAGDYILRGICDYQTTNWETIQFLALTPQMADLIARQDSYIDEITEDVKFWYKEYERLVNKYVLNKVNSYDRY